MSGTDYNTNPVIGAAARLFGQPGGAAADAEDPQGVDVPSPIHSRRYVPDPVGFKQFTEDRAADERVARRCAPPSQ